jgi:hypothetical protein
MSISPYTRRKLAATMIAATCLGAGLVAIGASGENTAAASAAPVALDGAKAAPAIGKCSRLANRKARGAAAHASAGNAGRVARRTRSQAKARCLAHAKRDKKRSRNPVAPTQVPGGLVVGVDGGYGGWSDSEVAERTSLAAPVTRHEWDPAEPVDAQDDVMEVAVGEIHTRIHALLGGNQLGDPNHYREWVVAFIRRYGLGGSFWEAHPEYDESRYAITSVELGNEPYFGEMSASLYADTVRPALEDIHELGLPVSVALVSRVYGSDTSWIDTLYQRIPDLNSLVSAFADHPYWYGHNPSDGTAASPFGRVGTLRERMNELGANTKAIWITEYGESTAGCGEECVSEATQAAHLSEMIGEVAGNPEWGVKMLLLYQLRDRGSASGQRELQFGLLRQDGSPKPAYSVVQGAVQQFRG